jgi:diguanylate cyclase (GGDEF)-like protein
MGVMSGALLNGLLPATTASTGDGAGDEYGGALSLALRALDGGEIQVARELAQSVLIAAKASGNVIFEARALACLAHCDRASSRLRRASDTSRKAAKLFERLGEVESEATALTTLAHVSMLLGRNDEAVEAALLCVRLCDMSSPQPQAVFAHNCLGIAYCWSGNFTRANAALESAIQIAGSCTPPVRTYEPRLNLAWVEAARLADERYQTGSMASLERMRRLVGDFQRVESIPDGAAVVLPLTPLGGTVSFVLAGLLRCWEGDLEGARVEADHAQRSLSGTVSWLDALVHWVVAEVAWASRSWPQAEKALSEMKEQALGVEHDQLACVAHLLLAQIFELQGRHADARHEHRALRVRERRMASESLASREAVVHWQIGARQSERHLQQALVVSKQFEQWSLEDALTGIANRRSFEQTLRVRLLAAAAAGTPLTVAMIDVDRFKSINDTYSHQVGDRVLKTLAGVLTGSVRGSDLPARLAGDEFVVLFDGADIDAAHELCERIQEAVATFDWNSIADGLHVAISIGVATASEGDTIDSLMQRSDRSMYWVKPGWVPTDL